MTSESEEMGRRQEGVGIQKKWHTILKMSGQDPLYSMLKKKPKKWRYAEMLKTISEINTWPSHTCAHTHTHSCSHACTHSEWWEETDRQMEKVLPLPVGTLGHFCFHTCYPGCWRWHSQVCRRRPVSQEKEHIWVPASSLWITKSTNWASKSNIWVLQIPESQSWG